MKKIIYSIVILAVVLMSCGGDAEITNYKNTITNSTTEADTIKATRNYLVYVVLKEQENQQKNAKKINADDLLEVLDTLSTVGKTYPSFLSGVYVRINQATATMLLGAYSESKSELVEAVEFVQGGIDIFDTLIKDYPNNMAVRAYRIVNYASLPKIFGKEKFVEKDVAIFLPFLADVSALPVFEKGLFEAMLGRLETFYGEAGNTDRLAEVKKMMEHLQTMDTANDSASIINQ